MTQETKNNDPFLQRAIEYWLDSSNELGYQPLFCELLTTQGYTVKYAIKSTTIEQGKDVVAIDADKIPHAFQLKGGDINTKRWREEVKPEIEAMIDCPIIHPDIDKKKEHVSYLITNGEINDAVRLEIVSLNEKKWKNSPLKYWTRGDLLNGFQQMAEGILPSDAQSYKKLIDLIFADGEGLADIKKVSSFLYQILNIDNPKQKKAQRQRDIAAALLYANMMAGPHRKKQNYSSAVQIMVVLLSLVFHLIDKYQLEDKYWIKSYEIIWNDILRTAKLLEAEIDDNEFNKLYNSPLNTDLIPFRKYAAISIIYPLKLAELIINDENWKTILNPDAGEKYKNTITIWGEAALLPLVFLALTLRNNSATKKTSINFIENAIDQIIVNNGRKSKHATGLISPYYDLDFIVKLNFGLLEDKFEENFKYSSSLLKSFIEIVVRANGREFISKKWSDISFMRLEEFIVDKPEDLYLWRTQKGENLSIVSKKIKSWKELTEEADSFDGKNLPTTIKRFPEFLPFFLSVFPHRANSETIGFLDINTKE
ncbi:hypothetical protein KKG19_04755 [Patescibacteria group bacterium]|nr:hypothetical protein [Patescibacteria group bacterium]MBU1901296.1 hypothetical protein [Patescibacteria group bacterium]